MDNIFKPGDKYIIFKPNKDVLIGTVENISISILTEVNGYEYEVINLINTENQVISIGQTSGRIHKLLHILTEEEIEQFKKNEYNTSHSTRYE